MALDRRTFPATAWLLRRLTSRIALRVYLLFAVLVILFAAFIQIQARLLRHRAEALLSDIRQLEVRKSTWADAQKFMSRWGAWGHYDGSCTAAECEYHVVIADVAHKGRVPYRLLLPYIVIGGWLGGRPVLVTASFTLIDGLLWRKSFGAFIDVSPRSFFPAPTFDDHGYTLIGTATSASRLSRGLGPEPQLALHRDYLIGRPGGCETCLMAYTRFTPDAQPSDVQRLMNFDLSCISRWRPCREREELMPEAWPQYLAERDRVREDWQHFKCDYPLDLLGREAENAAPVEVVSSRMEKSGGEGWRRVKFRLVKRLKDAQFWQTNTEMESWVDSLEHLGNGSKVILLFHEGFYRFDRAEVRSLNAERCGVIPFTPHSLAEVERGIDEDYFASRPVNDHHRTNWFP
jgi:hypothetical protein